VEVETAQEPGASRTALLKRTSAAFQDFGRFETRVAEAVGIGDLPHIVEQADASQLVDRLPNGLDTRLGAGAGGVDLSEGQWQRIALARARQISAVTGAITVIVSHRFSTVTRADLILVLDRGRLAEAGSHPDLMALNGRYAELYEIQESAYSLEAR
jgi:ABC-type multidrug transport system fused ATPase/permease subunit